MLSKPLREALAEHPRTGLFWNPLRGLRRLRSVNAGTFENWVGERPDGSMELVRRGVGEASVKLLLNEARVLSGVEHKNVVKLLWTARSGDEELTLGFAWGDEHTLAYPLDLRWLLRAFIALSKAVGALHQAGHVHADLKPEAVRWSADPEALVLWSLHLAQAPGPRAFDAYAARYASPEQVAGGSLDQRSDVYALGVMLYSLFIRDRFPSILVPSTAGSTASAPRPGQKAALSPITCVGEFAGDEEEFFAPPSPFEAVQSDTDYGVEQAFAPPMQQMRMNMKAAPPPPPVAMASGGGDVQAVLGAKVLFALELERVIQRNTDISVAKALLGVIERATAQKPADRHPDANGFAAALAELLSLAEELAAVS